MERPLGPLKTIIDKELERSCVGRPERVLADKAIADSLTAERKVRQQVEQRLKERKLPKVQNWRGRLMRWRHVSDDDCQRRAVKSNDFLHIGQLRLTVTVCPRCKAAYRSGGVECHDTMSRLDMGWSMRLIPKNKVSTGNGETMSAMEKLMDRRDSVREGTVKQRNVKTWKATHFKVRDGKPTGGQEQKSMRPHQYSDWKRIAGGSSEW